ncbi:COG3650 family protein [Qipengyuania nanhaisediminis]|uniref:COG3650 family protein n=1 Tax=Qipengyuania nanhaisediminis TaxID=604088 RepID=UPI0038B2D13E
MPTAKLHATMSTLLISGALSACSQPTGKISRDAEPFDDIAAHERIVMIGTEPFWNLAIRPLEQGYEAHYKVPDNPDGVRFALSRFAGNNGLGFGGKLGEEDVQVALTPGQCSDGMSDRTYPYTATVAIGPDLLLGCGYTDEQPFSGEEAP